MDRTFSDFKRMKVLLTSAIAFLTFPGLSWGKPRSVVVSGVGATENDARRMVMLLNKVNSLYSSSISCQPSTRIAPNTQKEIFWQYSGFGIHLIRHILC